jgi:2-haloacid dehalogenase
MQLYVFDAYGTLFDVHAAAERQKDSIGPKWKELSLIWRAKHLEYTWVYSLAGKQSMFWMLAQRSLDHAIQEVGGGISTDVRSNLLRAYRSMDPYPEVHNVLSALKARGDRLVILSNGDADMLTDAVRGAKLDGMFDAVISVVSAGIFKPSPKVYQLIIGRFGGTPADVSFQSSNRWDIAGAKAYGFRCVWVNRTGAPEEYPDLPPDRTVRDLKALVES